MNGLDILRAVVQARSEDRILRVKSNGAFTDWIAPESIEIPGYVAPESVLENFLILLEINKTGMSHSYIKGGAFVLHGHIGPDPKNLDRAGTCQFDGHSVDAIETCDWNREY